MSPQGLMALGTASKKGKILYQEIKEQCPQEQCFIMAKQAFSRGEETKGKEKWEKCRSFCELYCEHKVNNWIRDKSSHPFLIMFPNPETSGILGVGVSHDKRQDVVPLSLNLLGYDPSSDIPLPLAWGRLWSNLREYISTLTSKGYVTAYAPHIVKFYFDDNTLAKALCKLLHQYTERVIIVAKVNSIEQKMSNLIGMIQSLEPTIPIQILFDIEWDLFPGDINNFLQVLRDLQERYPNLESRPYTDDDRIAGIGIRV